MAIMESHGFTPVPIVFMGKSFEDIRDGIMVQLAAIPHDATVVSLPFSTGSQPERMALAEIPGLVDGTIQIACPSRWGMSVAGFSRAMTRVLGPFAGGFAPPFEVALSTKRHAYDVFYRGSRFFPEFTDDMLDIDPVFEQIIADAHPQALWPCLQLGTPGFRKTCPATPHKRVAVVPEQDLFFRDVVADRHRGGDIDHVITLRDSTHGIIFDESWLGGAIHQALEHLELLD